jgi:hypothetical protein
MEECKSEYTGNMTQSWSANLKSYIVSKVYLIEICVL